MSQQIIDIGSSAGAGDGDELRTAFDKVNQNFTELYSGNISANTVTSVAGRTGDVELTWLDVAGSASVGNITALEIQMAANSAADRAYTDAAVSTLGQGILTDITINGGSFSNLDSVTTDTLTANSLQINNDATVDGSLTV